MKTNDTSGVDVVDAPVAGVSNRRCLDLNPGDAVAVLLHDQIDLGTIVVTPMPDSWLTLGPATLLDQLHRHALTVGFMASSKNTAAHQNSSSNGDATISKSNGDATISKLLIPTSIGPAGLATGHAYVDNAEFDGDENQTIGRQLTIQACA